MSREVYQELVSQAGDKNDRQEDNILIKPIIYTYSEKQD